jgi:hypothetical protein
MKNCDYYFFDNQEQIRQDSALTGNNSMKSLILEYTIIKQNARRKAYAKVFSVQGMQ